MVAERAPGRTEAILRGRIARSPVCRNGHARTLANTRLDGDRTRCRDCERTLRSCAHPRTYRTWRRDGLGRWYCVRCRAEGARGLNAIRWAAQPEACGKGHPFTPENTIAYRGKRQCRTCHQAFDRESRRRRAEARKQAGTDLTTAPAPISPLRASQAPLSQFDAVVAAQVATVREIAARGRPTFRDALRAGERARAEREGAAGATEGGPTPRAVIAAVAAIFGLDPAEITGRGWSADVKCARLLAYHAIREWCAPISLADIGRHVGGRDHSTVMSGVDKIARLVADGDPATLRDLAAIKAALVEAAS